MKLSELFENAPDIEIRSLMADSRKKRPDSIFFCVRGMMFDGHRFIEQAIENGAKVIVHSEVLPFMHSEITYIKVKDVTEVFNQVADAFYGYPSHNMLMFGITGTNGKSSVSYIIRDILNHFHPTGYSGTSAVEYGNVKLPPLPATPDIDDLHGILRDMRDAGMESCALEVSSIAVELNRVKSIDFDAALFTNLSSDHLDYHGSMSNYFAAKKKLFDSLKDSAVAVTNADDPYGMRIVADTPAKIVTYGIDNDADYQVVKYQLLKDKTRMTLRIGKMEYEIETNLVARFNIYNMLAAIAALCQFGISITEMLPYLNSLHSVEGRMERISEGQPFNILIDTAHTPDGIERVCQYAAAITPKGNRIIALTGSTGKRDTEKRPVFGRILDRYCDMIILTEDDPRTEKPRSICLDIAAGIKNTNYIILEDRYDAVRQAVELSDPGDTVLILGKGDERFIFREFGRESYEGDDAVAREVLKKYCFCKENENGTEPLY